MNIISGRLRRRKLIVPKSVGGRPSLSRVRKLIFDVLQNMVNGQQNILDLFACTGSLGFEALSIFDGKCTFIELNKTLCEHLRTNVEKLDLKKNVEILEGNAFPCLGRLKNIFSLVFLDPPYDNPNIVKKAIRRLVNLELINEETIIVVESSTINSNETILESYCEILKEKITGGIKILFLKINQKGILEKNNEDIN